MITLTYNGTQVNSLIEIDNVNVYRNNYIISVEDLSEDSGVVEEPASLDDAKQYLRLEGFTGNIPDEAFSYDDSLIEDLITEGRLWVEKYTGIHCVPKLLHVVFCNGNGYIELPGPVTGEMSGGTDELTLLGTQFPKVKTPTSAEVTTQYTAGYNAGNAPRWIKNAILAYVADHYENRGDESVTAPNQRAISICRPHRRLAQWV